MGDGDSADLVPRHVQRWLPLLIPGTVVWVGGIGALVADRTGYLGPDGRVDRAVSWLDPWLNGQGQAIASMSDLSHFVVLLVAVVGACVAIPGYQVVFGHTLPSAPAARHVTTAPRRALIGAALASVVAVAANRFKSERPRQDGRS